MLTSLRLCDLGVIAEATVEPAPGLTALTGETGAGKTMVVTGLGHLLGARTDPALVHQGADRLLVEGRFTGLADVRERLDELGAVVDPVDGDEELLVSRQVTAAGRSRALLGGAPAPLGVLAEVVGELATIHGQSEQVRLGSPERQRDVLDRAGGAPLAAVRDEYAAVYAERRQVDAELGALVAGAQERAAEQAALRFGLDEIGAIGPRPGEDAALAAEARRLQAVDDLRGEVERANHALSGSPDGDPEDPGAAGSMGLARKALDGASRHDEAAGRLARAVAVAAVQVNDVAAAVAGYLASLEADPVRLEAIAARQADLQKLTRRYGATVDEVRAWADTAARRLELLTGGDERIEALRVQRDALTERLLALAGTLSRLRAEAAARLEAAVGGELSALAMPAARVWFDLAPLPQPGPHGTESVQILFAAAPGSPPAPLAKAASGGELSRVRLALEVVLAEADPGHTFVFDEVDAGVGGAVGLEIGRRLARLARCSQVIVVTHLAQVAAFADRHFVVTKTTGTIPTAKVREVAGADRVAEVARMMGGLAASEAGLGHARDLLAEAARR